MVLRKYYSLYYSRSQKRDPDKAGLNFVSLLTFTIIYLAYARNSVFLILRLMSDPANKFLIFIPATLAHMFIIVFLLTWQLHVINYRGFQPTGNLFINRGVSAIKLFKAQGIAQFLSPSSLLYALIFLPYAVLCFCMPYGLPRLLSLGCGFFSILLIVDLLAPLFQKSNILRQSAVIIFAALFFILLYMTPTFSMSEDSPPQILTLSMKINMHGELGAYDFLKKLPVFGALDANRSPSSVKDILFPFAILIILLALRIWSYSANLVKGQKPAAKKISKIPGLIAIAGPGLIYLVLLAMAGNDTSGARTIFSMVVIALNCGHVFAVFSREKLASLRILHSRADIVKIIMKKHGRFLAGALSLLPALALNFADGTAAGFAYLISMCAVLAAHLVLGNILALISPFENSFSVASPLIWAAAYFLTDGAFFDKISFSLAALIIFAVLYVLQMRRIGQNGRREFLNALAK